MRKTNGIFILLSLLILTTAGSAQMPGRNAVVVRSQRQDVYYYPAAAMNKLNRKVLFAPGDGGWRGWAIDVARQMAGWGYDVYGIDTKTYLTGFTGKGGIRESDVPGDFRQLAYWMTRGSGERVTLVGWSEGAGLCVLAAAGEDTKRVFNGVVTFGLGNENVLGWSWVDNISYVTRWKPREPTFSAARYMARIAPLPCLMIESTNDYFVPADEAKMLAEAAREPRRLIVIPARNHQFDGNTGEFYRTLREGLTWMK